MKCHVIADVGTGYVHTITATPADVHDIIEAHKLLREDDEVVIAIPVILVLKSVVKS